MVMMLLIPVVLLWVGVDVEAQRNENTFAGKASTHEKQNHFVFFQ